MVMGSDVNPGEIRRSQSKYPQYQCPTNDSICRKILWPPDFVRRYRGAVESPLPPSGPRHVAHGCNPLDQGRCASQLDAVDHLVPLVYGQSSFDRWPEEFSL